MPTTPQQVNTDQKQFGGGQPQTGLQQPTQQQILMMQQQQALNQQQVLNQQPQQPLSQQQLAQQKALMMQQQQALNQQQQQIAMQQAMGGGRMMGGYGGASVVTASVPEKKDADGNVYFEAPGLMGLIFFWMGVIFLVVGVLTLPIFCMGIAFIPVAIPFVIIGYLMPGFKVTLKAESRTLEIIKKKPIGQDVSIVNYDDITNVVVTQLPIAINRQPGAKMSIALKDGTTQTVIAMTTFYAAQSYGSALKAALGLQL